MLKKTIAETEITKNGGMTASFWCPYCEQPYFWDVLGILESQEILCGYDGIDEIDFENGCGKPFYVIIKNPYIGG